MLEAYHFDFEMLFNLVVCFQKAIYFIYLNNLAAYALIIRFINQGSVEGKMAFVTRGHKTYFAAVGLLALWVGFWGYFIPAQVDFAIPWLVPPLHSRFLGAMYLSGATFMAGCILARRWAEVRVVVPMIAIWTGMLFVVSLFYLDEFDFSRPQVWIWFAAYLVYPAIAIWLAWQHRADSGEPAGPNLPRWAGIYLLVQGGLITLLALDLLFLPALMVSLWPWSITPLLAQLYAAPFLSYGVGRLMLSRRRTWPEIRIAVTGTLVFVAGVLLASIIHRQLFSSSDPAGGLWFAGFGVAVIGYGTLTILAHKMVKKET
jgi:hypothetical protein